VIVVLQSFSDNLLLVEEVDLAAGERGPVVGGEDIGILAGKGEGGKYRRIKLL
jgi:hypothetical protein